MESDRPRFIHAFIHSFIQCLLSPYYVPVHVLGSGDTARDTVKSLPSQRLYVLVSEVR